MRRHVHECAAPAVRDAPAAAVWNRASRECGSRDRESPPPPPPDRTTIRAPLRPRRPPSPLLTPTHFFRSAACSAAFSADAVSPPTETARTRTQPSQCSTLRLGDEVCPPSSLAATDSCKRENASPRRLCFSTRRTSLHAFRLKVTPLGNHYFDYERTLSVRTCTAMLTTSRFARRSRERRSNPVAARCSARTSAPRASAPVEKLIHLALPVRLTHMQNGERGEHGTGLHL